MIRYKSPLRFDESIFGSFSVIWPWNSSVVDYTHIFSARKKKGTVTKILRSLGFQATIDSKKSTQSIRPINHS